MKEEFGVAVRGGCIGTPEIKKTVRAKDLLKANEIVTQKYGQSYVAVPKLKKPKDERR